MDNEALQRFAPLITGVILGMVIGTMFLRRRPMPAICPQCLIEAVDDINDRLNKLEKEDKKK